MSCKGIKHPSSGEGLGRLILGLAIPSIISNITVPLLSMVDLAIMGHIGNALYLAAISVGTMIFNVMYWVMCFLRMGTSGMTAQALGRDDKDGVQRLFSLSLGLSLALGLSFLVLFIPIRYVSMMLMQVGAESQPLVTTYFNICIFGAPAVLGAFALNGWLIGMQNTKTPMYVAISQNIINIVLSLLFVYWLKMDIAGVALGTMLSQWLAFLLLLFFALTQYPEYTFIWGRIRDAQKLKTTKNKIKQLMKSCSTLFSVVEERSDDPSKYSAKLSSFLSVNSNIFFRTLCLVAVNLYFTSAGSAQGPVILAVNTLMMTFFTMFSYIMDGFAFAGEALGGKYYGAGETTMLKSLHRQLLLWGLLFTILFTAIYAFGGDGLLSLLTNNKDVIEASHPYFHYALLIPVCGVLAFIYDGLFIGLTRTSEMLLSCFVGAIAFFGLYLGLRSHLGNNALWIALLAYLLLRGLVLSLRWHFSSI